GAHLNGHLEGFLEVLVLLQGQVLRGLDEEVDDLGDRHVERRTDLRPRREQAVVFEFRGDERDAEVTGEIFAVLTPDEFAADEVRDLDPGPGGCGGGHVYSPESPRT